MRKACGSSPRRGQPHRCALRNRTGGIGRPVRAVGPGREQHDAVQTIQRERARQHELLVAPAAAFPLQVTVVSPPISTQAGGARGSPEERISLPIAQRLGHLARLALRLGGEARLR